MMKKEIIIAHRGASGYLPEHTLASKALAFGLKSDYIEQDLVMSSDNYVIVSHDLYLNYTTNVKDIFPDRDRSDGKYYIIDFTLKELKKLKLSERFHEINKEKNIEFPGRFPVFNSEFKIHTLEEEIELIQGLNKSMKKNIGIYPEIKYPDFHLTEGKDISKEVLKILEKYNYKKKTDKIYLQCFDKKELRRIKNKLFKDVDIDIKIIQLIGKRNCEENFVNVDGTKYQRNGNYAKLLTKNGIGTISKYADGVGLHFSMIINYKSTKNNIIYTDIIKYIKENNLESHIYTIRSDNTQIPDYAKNFQDFVSILQKANIDGIFTDFPDQI